MLCKTCGVKRTISNCWRTRDAKSEEDCCQVSTETPAEATAETLDQQLPPEVQHGVNEPSLRILVNQIEDLEDDKIVLNQRLKELYSEAKEHGFMVKVLRLVIRRRKRGKQEVRDEDDLVNLYESQIGE